MITRAGKKVRTGVCGAGVDSLATLGGMDVLTRDRRDPALDMSVPNGRRSTDPKLPPRAVERMLRRWLH